MLAWLILTLVPLPAVAEGAEGAAPVVRVHLRRLNLTDRADLQLEGRYSVQTDAPLVTFPAGAKVTVQIREGQLYLFYAGMGLRLGTAIAFIRHGDAFGMGGGIRFSTGGNLYPGDLTLTVRDGQLFPVMALSMEDYLQGVVPYEMSDAFPLEALKAQAICARTYAMAHRRPDQAYDVVDTTNDQVFKGVNPNHRNAIQAVRETAGLVVTWKGSLATCYYAASNGGQTEPVANVWKGDGDYGYTVMQDDNYDLENPESPVRKAFLPKAGGETPTGFRNALAAAMGNALAKAGFPQRGDAIQLDQISQVKLHTPRHKAPSRLMTQMDITFRWSGRTVTEVTPPPTHTPAPTDTPVETAVLDSTSSEPTATPEPSSTPAPTPIYGDFVAQEQEMTLTLPLFPHVVRGLGLAIAGSENELITLREDEQGFYLESRRFGHGVGMSQRGAQWMASHYGKAFHEILAFYYPGTELMQAPHGIALLPTPAPALANSPGPSASPTPRPTLMPATPRDQAEQDALYSVQGIEEDSTLNLRQEPSTASEILQRLYKHQQLIVTETLPDGWVKVRTDVTEGYVIASFLEKVK